MEISRRNSRQRTKLREILSGRKDHPDAQTVYKEIREFYPSVSLGTVYRNLMLLVDNHELQIINVGDGKVHFDPNILPHAHFYCTHCHRVTDFSTSEKMKELLEKQLQNFKGEISACEITFRGCCEDCLQQKK